VGRIGDGDPYDTAAGQVTQGAQHLSRTTAGHQREVSQCVHLITFPVQHVALDQLLHVALIGRKEDVRGRSAFDLGRQRTARAEDKDDPLTARPLKRRSNLAEWKLEVRGGEDRESILNDRRREEERSDSKHSGQHDHRSNPLRTSVCLITPRTSPATGSRLHSTGSSVMIDGSRWAGSRRLFRDR
jgi:hypothetical protein